MFEMTIGRFFLAQDRDSYSLENLPLAVLTVKVDGRNVTDNDPMEKEVAIAVWDGLDEEDKIAILTGKNRNDIIGEDYELVAKFNLDKLQKACETLNKWCQVTGQGIR